MKKVNLMASVNLCFGHEEKYAREVTWCRLIYGRDLMWVKSGAELWEILHFLITHPQTITKKCQISLAKYKEPTFDIAHVSSIDTNFLFLPPSENIPHVDRDSPDYHSSFDEAVDFICAHCQINSIPSPDLVEMSDEGYFLHWNNIFTGSQINEWRRIQRLLRKVFAVLGAEVCTSPNVMLWYKEPRYYSFCEIQHDRNAIRFFDSKRKK